MCSHPAGHLLLVVQGLLPAALKLHELHRAGTPPMRLQRRMAATPHSQAMAVLLVTLKASFASQPAAVACACIWV